MTTRRDGRPSQVRPRPPSSGRPVPVKARPRGQAPGRIAAHRRVERTRGLALPFRLLFVVAVVALCAGVLIAATGGIGKVAASVGSTFVGFFADLTATPVPSATPSLLADTPVLQEPGEPYTNQPTIDLVGTIPADVVGKSDIRIRVYVAIGEQEPGIVTEVPVGRAEQFIVPGVGLIEGSNAFTTTLIGPTGESEPSPVVTYVLDAAPPTIKLSSPKDGAVINAKSVKLVGQTQARSELRVRNASSEAAVTGQADANGNFSIILPIGAGTNNIGITAIDPAGNEGQLDLAVRRGSGALAAKLSASVSDIKRSALPEPITMTVAVTDPDGHPLAGANVTFSLTVPRIPPITSKVIETNVDGIATWSPNIPKGADTGEISATVIVKTTDYGDALDRTVIRIRK
jgi:Big-like domain-containing protein